jgi:predicted aldo/keto reductase-like oxidoreductase
MTKIINKLIIGTVQFHKRYGLSQKKISGKRAKKLIEFLKKKKLLFFDDALTYNFSKTLKNLKLNGSNFKFITKIPKYNGNLDYEKKIISLLNKNLFNSNLKKYDSILLHDTLSLNKIEIINSTNFLKKLKKIGLTKSIGFSIYNKKDFFSLRKYLKPDIIQAPVNIFDQEFLD